MKIKTTFCIDHFKALLIVCFVFMGNYLFSQEGVSAVVTLEYDETVESFYSIENGADYDLIDDLTKTKMQRRVESKSTLTHLFPSGHLYTEITQGASQNAHPDWVTASGKTIIDEAKTVVLDQNGGILSSEAHSDKFLLHNMYLGALALRNPDGFGKYPFSNQSSSEAVAEFGSKGYTTLLLSGDRYMFQKDNEQIIVDFEDLFVGREISEEGRVSFSQDKYYTRNSQGFSVPSAMISKEYQFDNRGTCIIKVGFTRYSNYLIDYGRALGRGEVSKADKVIDSQLQIFPNPSQDHVSVSMLDNVKMKKGKIQILNLAGMVELEAKVEAKQSQLLLDISTLASGLYILKYEFGTKNIITKFIKE